MKKIISCFSILAFVIFIIGIHYQTTPSSNTSLPSSSHPKTITTMYADYPIYATARELVDSADLVFQGVITGLEYEMLDIRTDKDEEEFDIDDLMPYTLYTIDISKIYKGNIDNSTITIKYPGGSFRDTEYVLAENHIELTIGTDYLFLADTYDNTYPSLVNVTQAAYDINAPQTVSIEDDIQISLAEILDVLDKGSE